MSRMSQKIQDNGRRTTDDRQLTADRLWSVVGGLWSWKLSATSAESAGKFQ